MIRAAFAAIMTAVFLAILANKVPVGIQKKLVPAVLSAGLPESSLPQFLVALSTGSPGELKAVPGITSEVEAVIQGAMSDAYAYAYQYVYYALLATGTLAVILSLFLKDYNKYLTSHIARTIQAPHNKPIPVDNNMAGEEKVQDACSKEEKAEVVSEEVRQL